MEDRVSKIMNSVLSQELGEDWRTLGDLVGQAEAEPKLRLLQQQNPDRDIMPWSREELLDNLRRSIWEPFLADQLPPPIAQAMMQASLYLGPAETIKLAQQVAGVKFADGRLGPQ